MPVDALYARGGAGSCGKIARVTSPPNETAHAPRAGIREAKRALRERVLWARDRLSPEDHRQASVTIAATIAARVDFRDAKSVLLTLPFGSEWDTLTLIDAALRADKTVALPRVNETARMLELCAVTDVGTDVTPGYRGIREPHERCRHLAVSDIDWVLVPGVAFDATCRRLGYGGGFYDRMMSTLPPGRARVAGAFELQIVDDVPAAAHDLAIDAVVTERRTLAVAR